LPGKFETIEVELDEPGQDELLVRMVAAGLCHSDDHVAIGDTQLPAGYFPCVGGHEGAGIVERVGPNTLGYEVGDHVAFCFIASWLPVVCLR
jgi:S-(hydroxymethyl)glutathione dehydrogenase/alcohol dehydrogenase